MGLKFSLKNKFFCLMTLIELVQQDFETIMGSCLSCCNKSNSANQDMRISYTPIVSAQIPKGSLKNAKDAKESLKNVRFSSVKNQDNKVKDVAATAATALERKSFKSTIVTIVHFNDVYNIEPSDQEPVGGAARFATAINQLALLNPMVVFSGDALNPSVMSSITKGKQFVPVLNALNVQVACYGNHEFDHGIDNLVTLVKQMKFPWLLSNLFDILTGRPLGDAKVSHMLDWQGVKFGFIGLVEKEWLTTLSTVNPADVEYLDYASEGQRLAKGLKQQGADYVIALTHLRWPNDTQLANADNDIDLYLGGHDHDYLVKKINGKYVVKSGTDFRNYSIVTLTFQENGRVDVKIEKQTISAAIPENEDVKKIVSEFAGIVGEKLNKVIGKIYCELDGRSATVRSRESNLGNFIADIVISACTCDMALLNAGSFRSDRIHPAGDFRERDLMNILPMGGQLIIIKVTGKLFLSALENGVSRVPNLDGRFPHIGGARFTFDVSKPPGSRVVKDSVTIHDQPLGLNDTYRLCIPAYLGKGKNGYVMFPNCVILMNEDDGPLVTTIVKNHFERARIIKGDIAANYQHFQRIIPTRMQDSVLKSQQEKMEAIVKVFRGKPPVGSSNRWQRAMAATVHARHALLHQTEEENLKRVFTPQIDGRTTMIDGSS